MALLVTQCPSCESTFNASARLLQVADGLVRCGACLSVFAANDNLVEPAREPEDRTRDPGDSDSVFLTPTEDFFDALRFVRTASGWMQAQQAAPAQPEAEAEPIMTADIPLPDTEAIARDKAAIRASLQAAPLENDQEHSLGSLTPAELSALQEVPDTLELDPVGQPRRLLYLTGMGSLALVLLATLVLQFFWQQRNLLALHPDLRPGYEWVCGLLGCRLPAVEDISAITIDNLVVRSHPDTPGALIVSAVLRNTASHQQPFPVTRLEFSDGGTRVLAARNLQPSDYLPPSLRAIANMPTNTPVQISLSLVDPGPQAVNYQLTLVSR